MRNCWLRIDTSCHPQMPACLSIVIERLPYNQSGMTGPFVCLYLGEVRNDLVLDGCIWSLFVTFLKRCTNTCAYLAWREAENEQIPLHGRLEGKQCRQWSWLKLGETTQQIWMECRRRQCKRGYNEMKLKALGVPRRRPCLFYDIVRTRWASEQLESGK